MGMIRTGRPWAHAQGSSPALPSSAYPNRKAGKVRIHLDVEVEGIDTGRRQVEELGGRFSGFRHDYDEGVVLNMLDPEGNEFCLVQYFDRPPATR